MSYRPSREKWARCNTCRTRRSTLALLTQHLKDHPECLPCDCGGYGFYNGLTLHTKGSRYCKFHPEGAVNQASRAGASDADVAELKKRIAKERECPF